MRITKYYAGNQSHSQNTGVSERTMQVAHGARTPSLPSHDEVAYAGYATMSVRLGVVPMSFEDWYLQTEKINPADLRAFKERHHGADYYNTAGYSEPAGGRNWDGSWDNAVRSLER